MNEELERAKQRETEKLLAEQNAAAMATSGDGGSKWEARLYDQTSNIIILITKTNLTKYICFTYWNMDIHA